MSKPNLFLSAYDPRGGSNLAAALDYQAARRPDAPAVFFDGRVMSYGELRDTSREAAKSLLAFGVKRTDRLGILLGNQPEWLVLCFAAAYVGAVLVPLNTWYKKTELEWSLRHCGISVLVSLSSFLSARYDAILNELLPALPQGPAGAVREPAFPELRQLVMLGDPLPGAMAWNSFLAQGRQVAEADLNTAASCVLADDIAFLLYTSGSLAEPKGVLLAHGGAVRNGAEMGARRGVVADDRIWLGSPLFYGLGATNALPVALMAGAALVLQGSFEAGRAIATIADTQATVYYGTGNMSRAIVDHPDYRQRRIGSLKKGNAGTMTEYKRLTLVEMGISQASAAYGLTESYGNATVSCHDDPLEAKLNTSGHPLPGLELRIVDPVTDAELPTGQVGLVLLRGLTTPGYYANPAETALAIRGDGFFNTGDLGSLDGDGRFRFQARLKEVIKSGGINVSPLEVEQLLVQHPAVRDAYVVGVPDGKNGQRIVAFVDVASDVGERDLQAFIKERAASFKVPHHVLLRTEDQLPRLASGKVAKFKLAEEACRLLELG